MTLRRQWFGKALAALLLLSPVRADEAETVNLGPLKEKRISNGILTVGAVDEFGGTITRLEYKGMPANLLDIATREHIREAVGTDPYPYFYGYGIGGIRGSHHPAWPGLAFFKKAYGYETVEKDGMVMLRGGAEANGVHDERRIILKKGSSAFRVETTLTNRRDQYLDLLVQIDWHCSVPDQVVSFFMPDREGTIWRIDADMASQESRARRRSFNDWLAVLDEETERLLVMRYPAEQVSAFVLWPARTSREGYAGFYEYRRDWPGWLGLQVMFDKQETPPGGAYDAWQSLSVYRGLHALSFVDTHLVAELQTASVKPGVKTVPVRVVAASDREGHAETLQVRLLAKAGGEVLAEKALSVRSSPAGASVAQELELMSGTPLGETAVVELRSGDRYYTTPLFGKADKKGAPAPTPFTPSDPEGTRNKRKPKK